MTYPGDESQAIEEYLISKGYDRYDVSSVAYKAALRIAALAAEKSTTERDPTPETKEAK